MFQAPLAHLQEALHTQQLVYCMRIVSARNTPIVYAVPSEDKQVVLETFTGC
jgi:hypothetical protein